MGFFDSSAPGGLPIVTGDAQPDHSETWPLTLTHQGGGLSLALVAPHGTQPIAGIHAGLVPLLSQVRDGVELPFLCRTAPGADRNVRTLHAVQLATRHGLLRQIAHLLDEAQVRSEPALLAARARHRLQTGAIAGAIDDLRLAIAGNADEVSQLWLALPVEHRATLAADLMGWLERRKLTYWSLVTLPLEVWPTAALAASVDDVTFSAQPLTSNAGITFAQIHEEARRRGSPLAAQWTARLEHRARLDSASAPENLRAEVLARLAVQRDAASVSIYADALSEVGHPYGEFLTLWLKGSKSSLKAAKTLAGHSSRAWLGPLDELLDDVEYELGLPVAATFIGSKAEVPSHPMVPFFRRLLLARTGARRTPAASVEGYLAMVRQMALTGLDAGSGVIEALPTLDGTNVTHLFGLDVLSGVTLEARAWPAVEWVEVSIPAGSSLKVLDVLVRDRGGLFAARRPALALRMSGKASTAELGNVRAAVPKLQVASVMVNGKPLEP